MRGTIATVKIDKGYGFIRQQDGRHDLLFHVNDLAGSSLEFDDRLIELPVAYDIAGSDKGDLAANVRAAQ